MSTLRINLDKSKGRIPDAIRQAYSTVVTVSEKNEAQAFKINVTDEPHFTIIKNDPRSRIQDSSIAAEALLPEGPYDLWRTGETSRRVKDLSGSFAQLPHLPKMLKSQAITDTLVEGCQVGAFVLRLTRPDGSARTWWYSAPDDVALTDAALELVLSEAAELAEMEPSLLTPQQLPDLWKSDSISVQTVIDYFNGSNVVQVQRDGYEEPLQIPKASDAVVKSSISKAVESGILWLTNGPASILKEPIPAGVLTEESKIQKPPATIAAAEILPENLPQAWENEVATGLSITTAFSQKFGQTLPWKTVFDVIDASLRARFTELDPKSANWPCDFPSAQGLMLRVASGVNAGPAGGVRESGAVPNSLIAHAELEPAAIQDLGDIMPQILELKTKANVPLVFRVQIEIGDKDTQPDGDTIRALNQLLQDIDLNWRFEK